MTSPATQTLPDDRGTLTVNDRAVSTIASAATAATTGTTVHATSGLAKLVGRKLPRIDVHKVGDLVTVEAAVAAQWPQTVDEVASAARDRIATDVAEMSGQAIDHVDVTVQALVGGPSESIDESVPALTSGPVPRATPVAAWVGVLVSLLLIAGGVVAIREVLVGTGAIGGGRWLSSAVGWIDGLQAHAWMVPAGIGAAIAGLIVLLLALKPRRRTHLSLLADGVFLRRDDLAALLKATAGRVDGAAAVRVATSRRRAKIAVTPRPDADVDAVHRDVSAAVARAVTVLSPAPGIKVTTTPGRQS